MPIYEKGGMSFWPPIATDDELSIAALSPDGRHVKGWVRTPADAVWKPHDLIWTPPGAKSGDYDAAGEVVDVVELGDRAWVTSQLARRQRYLDAIKEMVRAGKFKLTAQLAKWLGIDEDGAELTPRLGPLVGRKDLAGAKGLVEEAERLMGPMSDNKHRYGLCSCHGIDGLPVIR